MKAEFSGLRAWAVQRATALAVLLFLLYVVLHLLVDAPASFQAWRAWIAQPLMRAGWMVFMLAVALHAWVGMRDVIIDYVKPLPWRLAALAVLLLGLALTVSWAAVVVSSF